MTFKLDDDCFVLDQDRLPHYEAIAILKRLQVAKFPRDGIWSDFLFARVEEVSAGEMVDFIPFSEFGLPLQ